MPTSPFKLETLNIDILQKSITVANHCEFGLVRIGNQLDLMILGGAEDVNSLGFEGKASDVGQMIALQCHLNHHNASAIRAVLAWLKPAPLGLKLRPAWVIVLDWRPPGMSVRCKKPAGKLPPFLRNNPSVRWPEQAEHRTRSWMMRPGVFSRKTGKMALAQMPII